MCDNMRKIVSKYNRLNQRLCYWKQQQAQEKNNDVCNEIIDDLSDKLSKIQIKRETQYIEVETKSEMNNPIIVSSFSTIEKKEIEKKEIEKKETEKNELFKIKCSFCKQYGHNKRTCKMTTIPVLAQQNDYKMNVKVEPEMSDSIHNMLIHIIEHQKQKEEKHDIWKDSPYKDLVKLQSNNVGNVGEELINMICKSANIPASCDGSKTKKSGGGEGDGKIMDISVEIKTSHQGSIYPSFQHELGEVPWKGSIYMIFVDISPGCIYLTIFKNFDEETYKSKKKLPCFPTKTITWRKEKGAFKLDTSVKINEQSIENGYAIKITPTTPNDLVSSFIRKMIV